MNKQILINHIKAASRSIKCDLVIKNVTIIDIFNKNRFIDNVAIKDGYIVGIGDYEGNEIIDGTNKYICPGLIDSHCHLNPPSTCRGGGIFFYKEVYYYYQPNNLGSLIPFGVSNTPYTVSISTPSLHLYYFNSHWV